ncbi:ligand-binding sensor domain-containing diguanylate cyclase [Paucibacter sp. PLA-PC-4]|uniref:ligand-binding sensor domain-containing diguanylate cyclase n=1 Tax=Paucibacter sp. PLA-PC-4 TaxID=2993655 RepID=UPI00224B6E3F|nr:ligand-binding sensor domain-containing diguanylate cyclase [Paucibacter sp. PLA-PC-4]
MVSVIALLLALLCALPAWADQRLLAEPRFEGVGESGRGPEVVSALVQDSGGLLWVGSSAGLLRYDGYELRAIAMPSAGRGEHGTRFVRSLLAARDGSLWLGTDGAGLARYDPARERWSELPSEGATVRALIQDSAGRVWAGTQGGGLLRFDAAPDTVSGADSDAARRPAARYGRAQGLPDERIHALLVDAGGDLWVGTWNGLARCRRTAERCEPVFSDPAEDGLAGQVITLLGQTQDGRIWVGTRGGDLLHIDPSSGAGRWVDRGDGGRSAYYAFAALPPGEIWLGRNTGIERRRAEDGALLQLLKRDIRKPWGLRSSSVAALLRDEAGWLWVGSFGGGLQRHNATDMGLSVLRQFELADGSVLEADVRSVTQLRSGEIWLGLAEQGVAVLDAQLRPQARIAPSPGGLSGSLVGAIAEAADGRIWVGSDARLYQFSASRRLLGSQTVGRGRIRRLLTGPAGQLWIGTEDGLFRRDANGVLSPVEQAEGRALGGNINSLLLTPDGALWVGSEFGLYRQAPGATWLAEAVAELPRAAVLGLLLDASEQLWIDTNAGLHRLPDWRSPGASIDAVAARHGFGGHTFGANLLADAQGRLWTHSAVFDPQQGRHYALKPQDGSDLGTGWFRSYAALSDGRMLFGGSSGLLVVEPSRFKPWNYAPRLAFSALRVDGQRVALGGPEQRLVLEAGQALNAEFAALDFSSPQSNRYRYRLEGPGADARAEDWLPLEAGYRLISLSGLAPGEYRLRVQGSNRAGVWSPHELSLPLVQRPAWWQSWWGRMLGAGLLALAMLAVVQLRTRFLQRRQRELEARVRERTEALEHVSAELRRKSEALEQASLTDPLTGLHNRRFLAQHIEGEVALVQRQHEEAQRQGQEPPQDGDLLFFLLDLDHFKGINDRLGHAAGDAVLRQMRARLEAVFREADFLVRWGGEEFLIVARGSARSNAPALAERARQVVAQTPFVLDDGGPLSGSCSIGFAAFPLQPALPRALDWAATLALADAALYQAKTHGRDGWAGVLAAPAGLDAQAVRAGAADPAAWLAELPVVRSWA